MEMLDRIITYFMLAFAELARFLVGIVDKTPTS